MIDRFTIANAVMLFIIPFIIAHAEGKPLPFWACFVLGVIVKVVSDIERKVYGT